MLFDFSHLFHQSVLKIHKNLGLTLWSKVEQWWEKENKIQLFRQFAFLFKGLTKYLNMTMHIIHKQKAQSESPERLQRPI